MPRNNRNSLPGVGILMGLVFAIAALFMLGYGLVGYLMPQPPPRARRARDVVYCEHAIFTLEHPAVNDPNAGNPHRFLGFHGREWIVIQFDGVDCRMEPQQ